MAVLTELKKKLEDVQKYIKDIKEVVFSEFLGGWEIEKEKIKIFGEYEIAYSDVVLYKILPNDDIEKVKNRINKDMMRGTCLYKWVVLLHKGGIFLLNRDVQRDETKGINHTDGVVLQIVRGRAGDDNYFKYFYANQLISSKKNVYFYRDIVSYKNINYDKAESTWKAYSALLKRFFKYYTENRNNYCNPNDNSWNVYDEIGISDLQGYIKSNQDKITSLKTVKNNFYYLKSFMETKSDKNNFENGIIYIEEFAIKEGIVNKNPEKEFQMTHKMINDVLKILEINKGRLKTRNQVLFLLMVYFGMERRKLCELKWSDIEESEGEKRIIFKDGNDEVRAKVKIPEILSRKLNELKKEQSKNYADAVFIFGNSKTCYKKRLSDNSINSMMGQLNKKEIKACINGEITSASMRKWLFWDLIKSKCSLEEIIFTLNIPLSNLESYIKDDELKKYYGENHVNPLENMIK